MQRLAQIFTGRHRIPAVAAVSALIGLVAAGWSTGVISFVPLKFYPGGGAISAASAQVMIDSGPSSMVHQRTYALPAVTRRGEWLAHIATSDPAVAKVAKRAGISASDIAATTRLTANVPVALSQPSSEQRASDIRFAGRPYRIEVQARQMSPVLDVYAQASSTELAERLADDTIAVLREEIAALEKTSGPGADWMILRPMGPARGGVVNGGLMTAMAVLTFTLFAALSALLLLRLTRGPESSVPASPRSGLDNWPHTTRMVPWLFAGFLALLWLLPFNEIELTMRLPIDLKLDRLVLPFLAIAWLLALAVGGRVAPRLRWTWIHAGIGGFLVVSFLSVILNTRELNQALELEESLKRLPLLLAYSFLFLVAATAIRRQEVRAFMTYTLGLSVVCAIGVLWEYRFKVNPFFTITAKLLPGFFSLGDAKTLAVDDIGRRLVRGPAALPLEAVAMMSMGLPIALVRCLQSDEWRARLKYGLGACLLLAAMFATYRKSALLAPFSVIATLAYFRRRELLKLSPLALLLIVLVHILAPGAIGGTTNQFDPGRLGVTTVSDRTADYDAIRPELWTHMLFGRGSGSYDHVTYRILDSEFLHRLIEMGVLGLIAYLLMPISVLLAARKTIALRDPRTAPWALAGAAAAVSYLVVSALFDVLSFPHPTYIFLYLAGLVSVVIQPDEDEPQPAPVRVVAAPARRPVARPPVVEWTSPPSAPSTPARPPVPAPPPLPR